MVWLFVLEIGFRNLELSFIINISKRIVSVKWFACCSCLSVSGQVRTFQAEFS